MDLSVHILFESSLYPHLVRRARLPLLRRPIEAGHGHGRLGPPRHLAVPREGPGREGAPAIPAGAAAPCPPGGTMPRKTPRGRKDAVR